ncbi:MAG: exo-alpha-sialidase [Candidatus Hydrogenedentes bacterium]|nr:exo-alpha-sialidase [Candidatus Hydrogenedentota bacterium]
MMTGYRRFVLLLAIMVSSHAAFGMEPLDPNPAVIWQSPNPKKVFPRSPGLLRLDDGRLIFTLEYSSAAKKNIADATVSAEGRWNRGQIHVSDDRGRTFRQTHTHPLWQGRPFWAGDKLYYLGHDGDLGIIVSEDRGETWSEVSWLTEGQAWHQAPCNVRYAHGKVYLVMERIVPPHLPIWPVQSHAPVVLAAPVDADLTKREAWTFSNEVTFKQMVDQVGGYHGIGVPFYKPGPQLRIPNRKDSRPMAPPGWLETNIVTFPDPDHVWHDPADRTMYLYLRANTGMTNMAALAKAVEGEDGTITVMPAEAPSGEPMLFMRMPGGHLKFYLLYDEVSKLYWLVSNQSSDSMVRPDRLPDSRYMLGDNERDRLVLHFSKNAMDWCFAGLVDKTGADRQARSYPSMVIDGDDLLIVARSGSGKAKNAHDADAVTLHRVKDFRGLVY